MDVQQTVSDSSRTKQACMLRETLDSPFDFTLVVKGGRKFKAHRHVLSSASPFLERLMNTDMKESNEGVVFLETIPESIMVDILDFIYTGSVQILTVNRAQEIIAVADYLLLPALKTVAEKVLLQKLNTSNCISNYSFGETYGCSELVSRTKRFILENFTTVARSDEFLDMTSEELALWISCDEIFVTGEEEVFEILLRWIDRNKTERRKYFSQLFPNVRLKQILRSYLHSHIFTNDLVKDNDCLLRVDNNEAMMPRRSLVSPAIIVSKVGKEKDEILCYFPRDNTWGRLLRNELPEFCGNLVSCHGKLYFIYSREMYCYDSFSDCWSSLPIKEERKFRKVFVRNENEIFALVTENETTCPEVVSPRSGGRTQLCGTRYLSTITRYRPETNAWKDITTFDLSLRHSICIVANDNYIYFIGGRRRRKILSSAERFHLGLGKWEKIANTKEARFGASGAAAHRKVFVVGGGGRLSKTCEVYDEKTNEWQFIASLNIELPFQERIMICVDGSLYVISGFLDKYNRKIECYDPEQHTWVEKTEVPVGQEYATNGRYPITACSMGVYKGSNMSKWF